MKVIDLLNKIANGEQPSHIRVYGGDWYWNNYDGYVTKSSLSTTPDSQNYLFNSYRLDFALEEEVEIIEEDKEIEKIEVYLQITANGNEHNYINYNGSKYYISTPQRLIIENQNKLIDEVSKLKNKLF